MPESRAWSLLTIEGSRQYGGNTGYADDPKGLYRYDSDVPNHQQIQIGDIVIIRSRDAVLGISEVEFLASNSGLKKRFRCPECDTASIKRRSLKKPEWLCKAGHSFATPKEEIASISQYEAHFGTHFVSTPPSLTVEVLNAAVLRPSDQMSIKEVGFQALQPYLGSHAFTRMFIDRFAARLTVPDIDQSPLEQASTLIESRRTVLREIAIRRGQGLFRQRLIRRYGLRCQVSGYTCEAVIEAAHIRPYCESGNNDVRNGLLLRSDIHTLFDVGLLSIHPITLKISLSHLTAGYGHLEGTTLCTNGTSGPSRQALQLRWDFFA